MGSGDRGRAAPPLVNGAAATARRWPGSVAGVGLLLGVVAGSVLLAVHLDLLLGLALLYFDAAGLALRGGGDGEPEHAVGVGGLHMLGVHRVTELQLPGEAALAAFGDQDLVALTERGLPFGPDGQDVPFRGHLHRPGV